MKNLERGLSFYFVVVWVVQFSVLSNGQDDEGVMVSPMEKTEKNALYSTIQGFVGKWWNGSDLYPDPCGWTPIQGVACDLFDGLWYVTDLSIGRVLENSLSCAENVEFNPYLFELRHLRSLSIVNCFAVLRNSHVTIPTENWKLLAGSLESLELRSNPGLTGKIPACFGEITSLKSLVVTENGLAGEIPASLGNLVNLNRLHLAENRLNGSLPDSFSGLEHLLILDISRNLLSGYLPSGVGGLKSLLKLDLSNNRLEGNIPVELQNLKDLILLDISSNRLSGGLTKSLQELVSLEELVLSNNPIGGDLTNIDWCNLRRLNALDLSNTSLIGGIPKSIADLKQLRFLGLGDNMLTGEIPPSIATLPSITAIYIHGNNLTGVIKFPKWFYQKMGRRFGAWSNPNLCYPAQLMSVSYMPVGVRQCEQEEVTKNEVNLDSRSKFDDKENWKYDPTSIASGGISYHCVGGLNLRNELLSVLTFTLLL